VQSDQLLEGNQRADLLTPEFYENGNWMEILLEILFKLRRRGVSVRSEVYSGTIQFFSCLYVLAVIPQQLVAAGYNPHDAMCITAVTCGVGSIFAGLVTNLPFIIVPPTAVSIFFSVFLRQSHITPAHANLTVILAGFFVIFLGFRPIGRFFVFLIPHCIQIGVAVGVGLFTAMAGSVDIDLVIPGTYTIVNMGIITDQVLIALSGVVIIAVALHYHHKPAFCYALVFCTCVYWANTNSWPSGIVSMPTFTEAVKGFNYGGTENEVLLTLDLFLLSILFLNGLIISLGDLSQLTRPHDGSIPRSRWLYVICGLVTVLSGCFSGPPVLISPESAAGIKAGARTGLSTVVCGVLFTLTMFLSPIFEKIPSAGTSSLLVMIGAVLFQNVGKIDWKDIKESVPAFITLFYIVATYSILRGAMIGYAIYLLIHLLTGDLEIMARKQLHDFLNPKLSRSKRAQERRRMKNNSIDDAHDHSTSRTTSGSSWQSSVALSIVHQSSIRNFFDWLSEQMEQVDEAGVADLGITYDDVSDAEDAGTETNQLQAEHPQGNNPPLEGKKSSMDEMEERVSIV